MDAVREALLYEAMHEEMHEDEDVGDQAASSSVPDCSMQAHCSMQPWFSDTARSGNTSGGGLTPNPAEALPTAATQGFRSCRSCSAATRTSRS